MDSRRQGAPGAPRQRRTRPRHGVEFRRFPVFRTRRADHLDVVAGRVGRRAGTLFHYAKQGGWRPERRASAPFPPTAQAVRPEGRREGLTPVISEDDRSKWMTFVSVPVDPVHPIRPWTSAAGPSAGARPRIGTGRFPRVGYRDPASVLRTMTARVRCWRPSARFLTCAGRPDAARPARR